MDHQFIGQLRELDVRIKNFPLSQHQKEQLQKKRDLLARECNHQWPDGDTANLGTPAVCICQICDLDH